MKGKKKKEEDISSEIPEKKPAPGGRLSGMIESMQKRGSPVNAHRVATAYFDSFRKERNIPRESKPPEAPGADEVTAVGAGERDTVTTAVGSAVKKEPPGKKTPKETPKTAGASGDRDPLLSPSEHKVYSAIYNKEGSPGVRLGLKELRELTGLSDKTVRVAVHSLVEKLSVEIMEPALGIYGRKYRVFGPEETARRREESGLVVDPVTKRVLSRTTPVTTAVSSAVYNTVGAETITTVSTAVITAVDKGEERMAEIVSLYEKYSGNEWGGGDDAFQEAVSGIDMPVIETAILLSVLKGESLAGGIGDILPVLEQLGPRLPAGYLENLREVWSRLKGGSGED